MKISGKKWHFVQAVGQYIFHRLLSCPAEVKRYENIKAVLYKTFHNSSTFWPTKRFYFEKWIIAWRSVYEPIQVFRDPRRSHIEPFRHWTPLSTALACWTVQTLNSVFHSAHMLNRSDTELRYPQRPHVESFRQSSPLSTALTCWSV